MSQPLLAALQARGEELTVAALPWVAPVYRAMTGWPSIIELPFAHRRLDWSARRELGRQLKGQFDAAYVLPNSLKSALLPWFAGIPKRVGYRGESRWGLINHALPNPGHRGPMVEFYLALAYAGRGVVAGGADKAPSPSLWIEGDRLRSHLQALGLDHDGYWAMAPGAEYGPAKCWPADHYAQLAVRLHRESGLPVVLLGSGKESVLADGIVASTVAAGLPVDGVRSLAGRTTLDQALSVIAGARGVVSNDSGLMHVAAALGRPQVAVFGSTSPEHTPPLNRRAAVIWLQRELALDCSPCFERTCRFGHTRCLTEVTPDRVLSALSQQVNMPESPPAP